MSEGDNSAANWEFYSPQPPPGLDVSDDGERCSICYELLYGEITVLPCNPAHRFHGSCTRQWCMVQSTCPLDRSPIPPHIMVPNWKTSIGIRFYSSRFLLGVTHGISLWVNFSPAQSLRYFALKLFCSIEAYIFSRVFIGKPGWFQDIVSKITFVGLMSRVGFGKAATLHVFKRTTTRLMNTSASRFLKFLNQDYDYEVLTKMSPARTSTYVSGILVGGLVFGRVVAPFFDLAFDIAMKNVLLTCSKLVKQIASK